MERVVERVKGMRKRVRQRVRERRQTVSVPDLDVFTAVSTNPSLPAMQ